MAKDDWQDDLRRRLSQAAIPQETVDALRRLERTPWVAAMRHNLTSFSESEAGRRLQELGDKLRSSTSRIGPMSGDGIRWAQVSGAAPTIDRGPGKPKKEDEVKAEARRIIRVEGKPRSKSALAIKVSKNIGVALSTAKKWAYPIWDE
jgi:hypothetical protein